MSKGVSRHALVDIPKDLSWQSLSKESLRWRRSLLMQDTVKPANNRSLARLGYPLEQITISSIARQNRMRYSPYLALRPGSRRAHSWESWERHAELKFSYNNSYLHDFRRFWYSKQQCKCVIPIPYPPYVNLCISFGHEYSIKLDGERFSGLLFPDWSWYCYPRPRIRAGFLGRAFCTNSLFLLYYLISFKKGSLERKTLRDTITLVPNATPGARRLLRNTHLRRNEGPQQHSGSPRAN
jgi:hypothetical protein